MNKLLNVTFCSISIAFTGACERDDAISSAEIWKQNSPDFKLDLQILSANKEPIWKTRTTILTGDVPRESWRSVPFALRRLCSIIPDLSSRHILIYRVASDYRNSASPPPLAIYNPETHQLAFNGGDYSWPVKINLGRNWC